ncbi:hypothetical protein CPB86DRAFT_877375 [Serendipita vermifera]|nr:hypothetical protein CPB86DRAFT_877375 [Serendipita vermifera]
MARLLDLPNEILIAILGHLAAKSILAFGVTTKRVQNLLTQSSRVKLKLELAVQGRRLRHPYLVQDHTVEQGASSALLARAQREVICWREFKYDSVWEIPEIGNNYQLLDDVFINLLRSGDGTSISFNYYALWQQKNSKKPDPWRTQSYQGTPILDFICDPSQNLLVIALDVPNEIRVEVRSMLQNLPHPEAALPMLQAEGKETRVQCLIKVYGSILVTLFNMWSEWGTHIGRLCIWNWRSGTLLYTKVGVGGYAFIDQDTLLVLMAGQQPSEIHLKVLPLSAPNQSIRLDLPLPDRPNRAVVYSEMPRSNDSLPKEIPTSPFASDETSERIVVLKLSFFYDTLFVVISVQHIRRLLKRGLSCTWTEWGPNATRWLHGIGDYGSHSSVSGARFCTQTRVEIIGDDDYLHTGQPNPAWPRSEKTIMIFDFNPRPIRKNTSPGSGDTNGAMIGKPVSSEWVWFPPSAEESITSRLPFTFYASQFAINYSEVMISSNHFIGRDGERQGYDIFQFGELPMLSSA